MAKSRELVPVLLDKYFPINRTLSSFLNKTNVRWGLPVMKCFATSKNTVSSVVTVWSGLSFVFCPANIQYLLNVEVAVEEEEECV